MWKQFGIVARAKKEKYDIQTLKGGKNKYKTKIGFLYLYNDFVSPQMRVCVCVCVCVQNMFIYDKEGTKTA